MRNFIFLLVGTGLLVTTMSAQIKRDEGLSASEQRAPPTVQSSLLKTRELIGNKNLGFRVGVTGIAGREMNTLAGTITPPYINRIAADQNKEAAKLFGISPDQLLSIDLGILENRHPLYASLIEAQPETNVNNGEGMEERLRNFGHTRENPTDVLWNFEKFLVGKNGEIVSRFAPDVTPDDERLRSSIEADLGN